MTRSRVPRGALTLLLASLVLASALAVTGPAAADHGPGGRVVVNVHTAVDHGCTPDSWTKHDYRARVWLDGRVVAETVKAQDSAPSDWFALLDVSVPAFPVTLALEVQEAEPGGVFGLGTSWRQCDVHAGAGDWVNVTLAEGESRLVDGRGDGSNAARVTAFVAPATGAHPTVATLTASADTDALAFSWRMASGADETAAPTFLFRGRDPTPLAAGASGTTVTGLQDNTEYFARLLRETGDWRVAGWWQSFRTANAAPPAADVTARAIVNGTEVSWTAAAHDLERVEVHAATGSASFTPAADTLRAERHASLFGESAETVTLTGFEPGTPVHVRVVTIDSADARTVADAVTVTPLAGTGTHADAPPTESDDAPTDTDETPKDTDGAPTDGGDDTPQDPAPVEIAPPAMMVHAGVVTAFWDPVPNALEYAITWWPEGAPELRRVRTVSADATTELELEDLDADVVYEVSLTVTFADGSRADAAATNRFTAPPVDDAARRLVVAFTLEPSRAEAGDVVIADATAFVEAHGDGYSFTWAWGDDSVTRDGSAMATHRYPAVGVYQVTLTVRSMEGREGTAMRALVVSPGLSETPPPEPVAQGRPIVIPGPGLLAFVGAVVLVAAAAARGGRS